MEREPRVGYHLIGSANELRRTVERISDWRMINSKGFVLLVMGEIQKGPGHA